MNKELNPCPFCGREAELIQDNNPPHLFWWVACYNNDCPVMPQASIEPKMQKVDGYEWECLANDKEQVIQAWNRRHNENIA